MVFSSFGSRALTLGQHSETLIHFTPVSWGQVIRKRFDSFEVGDLVVSSITEAELRDGAERSADPQKNHRGLDQLFLTLPVVPFDKAAAREYGNIRRTLERNATTIGPLDLLIASHARALALTVVTNNFGEFSRVADLKVEDWGQD
ncbi:MAG: type II toxin-antitoxin system VapC family toxin [Verrucomicrobiota bacterium]